MLLRVAGLALVTMVFSGPCHAGNLRCLPVPDDYSADTSPAEWAKLPSTGFTPDENLVSLGSDDLSASVALAWNADCLFVSVTVIDDVFHPPDSPSSFWNGDSLQIAFAPLDDDVCGRDEFVLGAAAFPFGHGVLATRVPVGHETGAWDVPFRVARHEDGLVYVLAIPWRYCGGIDPLTDQGFRFNVIVNDNDGARREGWVELADGIGEALDVRAPCTVRFEQPDGGGARVHAAPAVPRVSQRETLVLRISAINAPPGSRIRVTVGKATQELPVPAAATARLAARLPMAGVPLGATPIQCRLLSADGHMLAQMNTAVTVHDPQLPDRQTSQAREALSRIDAELARIAQGGRHADYLTLRRNIVRYAVRVAELAAREAAAGPDRAAFFGPIHERAARYLAHRCPGLQADVAKFAADADATEPEVPRPDLLQPWEIRDGEVLAGGRPVTLHGWVWQYIAKDHSYPLVDLGLNMQSVDIGPRHTVPRPFEVAGHVREAEGVRQMRANALEATRNGEVCDLHTSPHYLPGWFTREQHGPNSWMDTPDGRRLLDLHYQGLYEAFGDIACVKTADLANEWVFRSTSPAAMEGFRHWLAREYGSVAELNRSWGADLEGFAEVPEPFGNTPGTPTGLYQRRSAYWDWCRYNSQRAAAIVRRLDARLRKHYPTVKTHIKCVLSSYAYRSLAESFVLGIDPQRILPITDLIGTDASYIRGHEWVKTLFAYDYMRSVCPDKPIFCSETHAVPHDAPAAPGEIRRGLFQRFVHGERLNLMFLNTTLQVPQFWTSGESPRFNIGQAPEALEALALTGADLQRLTPLLGSFNRRRPSVLIFYDNAADFAVPGSDESPGAYADRALQVYESLLPLDVKVGVLTEAMLCAGLPRAELLVLAGARYVSDDTVQALNRYAQGGGHLLWLAENLTHDHHGRPRDSDALKDLRRSDRILRMPLRPDARGYAGPWGDVLNRAGVYLPVSVTGPDGKPVWGVEVLSAAGPDGAMLVFLANGAHRPVGVALEGSMSGRVTYTDLITEARIDPSTIHLATDQVMLLRGGHAGPNNLR